MPDQGYATRELVIYFNYLCYLNGNKGWSGIDALVSTPIYLIICFIFLFILKPTQTRCYWIKLVARSIIRTTSLLGYDPAFFCTQQYTVRLRVF
ncbi:hypothetical protein GIB67_004819 [Kingdonia uniflora]|uniref:Uncharacterized protein n=1 Tax=Kingdonia uniflora TaxID=39325 RepID=A0A7J7LNB8_9MAGN|nr:hypothetical protein GIB67_004819 [Kingdonia uniflora]